MAYDLDLVILSASDASASARFGSALAVNAIGAVMAVGAPGRVSSVAGVGGVYIYDRVSGAWVQRGSVILPSSELLNGNFGSAVAISGDGYVLAVGSTGESTEGAVFVFDWSGSAWVQRPGVVKPPAPYTADKKVGYSVALSSNGSVMAIGAPALMSTYTGQGAVYMFDWSGSAWVQRGSALVDAAGSENAYFGYAVAIDADGETLVVGAPYATGAASGSGIVLVYDWSGSAWVKRGTYLGAPDAVASDRFGFGVTIGGVSSGYLGVGAPYRVYSSSAAAGGYYLFTWSGSAWVHDQTFVAADHSSNDLLGFAAGRSADNSTLVVGSPYWEDGAVSNEGAVYTYVEPVVVGQVYQDYADSIAANHNTYVAHIAVYQEAATCSSAHTTDTIRWFLESAAANEAATHRATTTLSYAEQVAAAETLVALFNQLVADSASGSDTWYISAATMIAEVAVAAGIASTQLSAIQALSEVIVALELQQTGGLETISESAEAATLVSNLVRATQAILEQAIAAELSTSHLILVNTVSELVNTTETVSLWQSLNQAIEEGGTAFVHLVVAGEVYTGWVMNTQNGAVSEYQGLNFNSLCKLGTRYFGASETGLHELTGESDGGTSIATYIQSGIMDFNTSYDKSVQFAYLGVDIDGRLAVGVRVSEKPGPVEFWYEVTLSKDVVSNVKVPFGRGLKGRYWKFEVASEALSSFDTLSVLPAKLTRRV